LNNHASHLTTTGRQQIVVLQNLSPEERARIEKELGATSEEIVNATHMLTSTEFRQQIDTLFRQSDSLAILDRPTIQQAVDKATDQLDSPEFKRQMAINDDSLDLTGLQRKLEQANTSIEKAEAQIDSLNLQ
ncbi:MAG: hypothetical protein ACYCOU_26585, partial [Sulfobacillus sp.]